MKPRFSLTCIIGSAICISQLTLSAFVVAEPGASFTTSREIEKYAIDIVNNINKTALAILSISPDQHTFENTLRPWNRLSAQLFQDLDVLDALSKLDVSLSGTAAQVSDELHAYLLEVAQYPELCQTLSNCSLSIARNPELDPFQQYLGTRLFNNDSNEPFYVSGAAEEQNSPAKEYTVLTIKSGSLVEARASDLAHKILSENTDAVCIQEVADDCAYDLYKILHRNYAHFVYAPPSPILGLSRNHRKSGMLIASKFGADALDLLLVRSNRDRDDDKKAGGGFEVGGNVKYGGKDGPQFDGYIKAEAHDDKGNYAEGRIDHNFNKNEGNVGFRGGNKDDEDKKR